MTEEATTETETPAPKGPSFAELGLRPEILRAVTDMGFTEPMAVQTASITPIRAGRDIMVQSRTGSGKTAAFGIPLADSIVKAEEKFVQAIVVLPTRELALQVAAEIARICAHADLQVVPVYGGAPMGRQIEQLKAGGQIVCGTPGRVLDHVRRGTLVLDKVKCVVLDECDEMLSMGFQEDIEAILSRTPAERQTLLYSATLPEGIQRLSRRYMRDPEFIKLSSGFVGVHEIRHVYYSIPGGQREAELVRIVAFENPERAIIFCNTRDETGRLSQYLRQQGYDAEAISSDLSQADRERVMTRMRAGGIRFLVATDVAARGIDLENLPCVINYTIPESPEVYIHRTGRTGRAGRHGTAISLIGPSEVGSFYYIKLLYKIRPEERSLPSEAEIRSKREGERILQLRALLPGETGPAWTSLARRLMGAPDGERLVGALLQGALEGRAPAVASTKVASEEPAAAPRAAAAPPAPRAYSEGERPSRPRREERGDRPERNDRHDRSRSRGPRDGRERGPRPDRAMENAVTSNDRPPFRAERGERPERADRPARPDYARERPEGGRAGSGGRPSGGGRPQGGSRSGGGAQATSGDNREFWEVWSEEVGRTPTAEAGGESRPATEPRPAVETRSATEGPAQNGTGFEPASLAAPTQARLYLNLGRKDGAVEADVISLVEAAGVKVAASDLDVMNTHTYVNVPLEEGERLCVALSGKEHNGRPLVCERARPPKRRER